MAKVVAGCNGKKAYRVAQAIVREQVADVQVLYALALAARLGCPQCLAAQDANRALHEDAIGFSGSVYGSQFPDPGFNPRSESGESDFCYLIDVDKWTIFDYNAALRSKRAVWSFA